MAVNSSVKKTDRSLVPRGQKARAGSSLETFFFQIAHACLNKEKKSARGEVTGNFAINCYHYEGLNEGGDASFEDKDVARDKLTMALQHFSPRWTELFF